MITWWRRRREARVLRERAIPDALWHPTLEAYPLLQWCTEDEGRRLRDLASLFLADKEFHGAHGFEVTDAMAVAIAAQACLPVIHLGLAPYAGFVGIVVQPQEVRVQRTTRDDRTGVVTEFEDELSGEAVEGGPVMLAWTDVQAGGKLAADQPYNVVIHEFMHVLDATDGEMNGRPALPGGPGVKRHWQQVMEAAAARLERRVAQGRESVIDPYGCAGPEEFFAVAAEAFFAAPRALAYEEAALYALFSDYFGQDPARHAPPLA